MKNAIKDIKLHFVMLLIFGLFFPLLILGVGLLFPFQAEGMPIYNNGRLIGFENIGQKFNSDKYFWGRPSAVEYNAAATGGSNKGPLNDDYLKKVKDRIDYFTLKNPTVKKNEIPSDLVTASGSGIDPHITLKAAYIQVNRIAKERNIKPQTVIMLIKRNIEKPYLSMFGNKKVNVLKLNIELDRLN